MKTVKDSKLNNNIVNTHLKKGEDPDKAPKEAKEKPKYRRTKLHYLKRQLNQTQKILTQNGNKFIANSELKTHTIKEHFSFTFNCQQCDKVFAKKT